MRIAKTLLSLALVAGAALGSSWFSNAGRHSLTTYIMPLKPPASCWPKKSRQIVADMYRE